ncbi:MAG: hypothetical protein HY819_00025 [Acidobacteria bacterium]|nr:hypothetical protein [Acidobacteriota bacterium]
MFKQKSENHTKIIKIALIGFGNSACRLAELLIEREKEITSKYRVKIIVTAIATARGGKIISKEGINLMLALELVRSKRSLAELDKVEVLENTLDIIEKSDADIIIETTLLNLNNGEPAYSHIKQALLSGKDVVTANKGPLAFAAKELFKIARAKGVALRYESTVMDGTPVFNLVKHTLPLAKINRIRGIVNSTTNFILSEMEMGRDFAPSLEEAQRRGIAEADASLDIEAWDAAIKATVLANCLMDANLKPSEVIRKGISEIKKTEVLEAINRGKKIRLVIDIERINSSIQAKALPTEISKEDIFYNIDAFSNILALETDLMGTLMIVEQDPTLTQTAYGLLSDLLSIIEDKINL